MPKRILTFVITAVMIASLFGGCGAGKSETSSSEANMDMAAPTEVKGLEGGSAGDYTAKDQYGEAVEAPKEGAEASETQEKENGSSIVSSGTDVKSVTNAILAQRKIIRNANISVEVDDFDVSYGKIKSMINAYGFVQESNVKKQKDYKGNPITSGIIVIRVDRDKFDDILTGIKGLGSFIDESIKSDDVTDKYFDIESRLRLLRFEEGRLEDYLKKITDPDTIFKTEDKLTDIRHEIESLTGTIKKWNDLVALSTITINIYEKNENINNIPEVKSYSNRLSESFSKSTIGVANFFGEVLIFLVAAFPVLIVLGILAWLGFIVYRKVSRKKNKDSKITGSSDDDI